MAIGLFIFSDFVQYILPTIIAICLFIPFFDSLSKDVSIEAIVFGGAVFGYAVWSLMDWVVGIVYKHLPIMKKHAKDHRKTNAWMKNNWNHAKVFCSLPKDDRDYLYLVTAYKEFYRLVSFYMLVYFLVNLIWLIKGTPPSFGSTAYLYSSARAVTTPVLGGWQTPTYSMLLISLGIFLCTYKKYLLEYEGLFYPNEHYDHLCRKCHEHGGNVAKSVWGRVMKNETDNKKKALPNAKVELLGKENRILAADKTDEEGYFQFRGKYAECQDTPCIIYVKHNTWSKRKKILVKEEKIAYFEIEMCQNK